MSEREGFRQRLTEESTARASGTSHGMFMATFMEIGFPAFGNAIKFFQSKASGPAFQDTMVLLRIDIQRLFFMGSRGGYRAAVQTMRGRRGV